MLLKQLQPELHHKKWRIQLLSKIAKVKKTHYGQNRKKHKCMLIKPIREEDADEGRRGENIFRPVSF